MSYRRLDKPPFSAWLVAERNRRKWKAEEVARRLRELGYPAEDSTYRTWEATRRPNDDTVAALERLFGTASPAEDAPGSGDVAAAIRAQAASNDRMAIALERQAAAFTTLAASIDRAADGVTGRVAGFDELLRGLLVALGGPALAAPDEHPAAIHADR